MQPKSIRSQNIWRQRQIRKLFPQDMTNCWPCIEKLGSQNQNGFARALFQLEFNCCELAPNDAHHSVNFLWCHRTRSALLAKQIYHVCCEFIASLLHDGHTQWDSRLRTTKLCNRWTHQLKENIHQCTSFCFDFWTKQFIVDCFFLGQVQITKFWYFSPQDLIT